MDDHIINLYDTDFLIWVERQVKLLRGRQFDQLDLDHLTDEIADMGGQLKRELRHRLELLLMHLLKYRYQRQRTASQLGTGPQLTHITLATPHRNRPALNGPLNASA